MPRLQMPTEDPSTNTQPMSIQGVAENVASGAKIGEVQQHQGAAAIASAAQIGQTEQNFGSWMADKGNEYFSKAMKSMSDTIYNIVQSNAAQDYNQRASSYVSNIAKPSRSGSANYVKAAKLSQPGAVAQGLDSISKNVKNTYSEAISDPQVKARFDQSMTQLNDNHKVLAGTVERNTQMQVGQAALQQALSTDIQSGLIDTPDNIGYYAATGLDRIKSALDGGTIGPDEAVKMGDSLRSGLYFGSLQVNNQNDPQAVGQLLATKKPEDLNLTQVEYDQLKKQNEFALHDVNTMAKYQYQAQNEVANAQTRLTFGAMQEGIKDGSIKSAQIVEAYDKGKIDFNQYSQLANLHINADKKITGTWRQRQDISSAIQAGDVLSSFSNKQIDDHYQNDLRTLSTDGSLNVDIATKLNLVKQYKGPVDSFAKELQYNVMSGDPEKIKDAVYSFNKIQTDNPLVLSGVKDRKFQAYMASLSDAYKYTTSLNKDNIQKIHDSIYNVDGRTLRSRENDYSANADFNSEIKTTIANMYDEGNPWYRGADAVSEDTVQMLQPLFRDAYRQTGDVAAAKEMVANQTKALFGHSSVNVTPRFGIDAGTIMALPPEKIYAGKANAAEIRSVLNKEIAPILPKGVTADQVMIGSDDYSMEQFKRTGNPSYYLYYNDSNGHEVLLPKRWSMDSNSTTELTNMRNEALQAKVDPSAKVAPTPLTAQPADQQTQIPKLQKDLKEVLGNTQGFGRSPILNDGFIEKAGQAAFIPQIVSHYAGDRQQRPIVEAALTRMVGQDKESWRVAQSMKLVNSVLTNNSNPRTYLKFGTSTTTPMNGDIVVTNNYAGLFGGMQRVNNQNMVRVVSMDSAAGGLSVKLVPVTEVKGYRTLPTPENFVRQSKPLSINNNPIRFNPYTGGPARVGTGQERFNPYTMETSIQSPDTNPPKTVIDPATGRMVDLNASFSSKFADATQQQTDRSNDPTAQFSSYAEDVGKAPIGVTSSSVSRVPVLKPRSGRGRPKGSKNK